MECPSCRLDTFDCGSCFNCGFTFVCGDALGELKKLPDESVDCCVTSPPYFGLRDYMAEGQLGLEKTPEEYVSKMVEIFREVRRVLRDDGTLWLNLGISYAGSWGDSGHRPERTGVAGHQRDKNTKYLPRNGHPQQPKPPTASVCDKNPNRSPLLRRVPACGIDGKEFQGSQVSGRAYLCSCDGHRVETLNHHADSVHNAQRVLQDGQRTSRTDHDTGHSDCVQDSQRSLLLDVQESTTGISSCQHQDASYPGAKAWDYLQSPASFVHGFQESGCKSVCTSDTSQMLLPLAVRTVGKESFFSACGRSDCKGIGRCGLCWVSLAIPSLNVKSKDEINLPHLTAMALQADGWILRQTIAWHKPNPMPESVRDRCTKAHEYIFLLSKKQKYYFDHKAIKESAVGCTGAAASFKRTGSKREQPILNQKYGTHRPERPDTTYGGEYRNKRSVWTVATKPFKGAHFATFPPALIEPCVLAGSREGGTVLDPFAGAGTTGLVALQHKRNFIGIELNQKYINEIALPRLLQLTK